MANISLIEHVLSFLVNFLFVDIIYTRFPTIHSFIHFVFSFPTQTLQLNSKTHTIYKTTTNLIMKNVEQKPSLSLKQTNSTH